MKAISRILGLWIALVAIVWLLPQPVKPDGRGTLAFCLLLILPLVAVWLTGEAARTLPANRFARWSFWAVTLAGWLAVGLFTAGRYEHLGNRDERVPILLASAVALLVPAWLAVKARAFPSWRVLGEVTAGAALLVLGGGLFVWSYEAKTRAIAARAEARWAEIGRPLSAFEKSLAPTMENEGSAVVREVFRETLRQGFYKLGTPAAEREAAPEPSEAVEKLVEQSCEIISAKLPPTDEVAPSTLATEALAPHASKLDTAYRRILAAEPAVWACDPADGFTMSVPNFLSIRKFSQVAAAESMRRLAAGDEAGAARAVSAGLRVAKDLEHSPILVNLMIHVVVDGVLVPQLARLPADGDGLAEIARDAAAQRAALLRILQMESTLCLRQAERFADEELLDHREIQGLPKWARRLVDRRYMPRQGAIAALNGAEHAAVFQSPASRALPDFGIGLHDAISLGNPSICEFNFSRAAMRLEATLLLREQVELIRVARARLAAGQPVEARDSVVLPGVRWELAADTEKANLTIRMAGAPSWVQNKVVTSDDFWVLPLDGSVAWQFRPAARTAAVP